MVLANQEAQRMNHEYIGSEHVLVGLIKTLEVSVGIGAVVGEKFGLNRNKVWLEMEKLVKCGLGTVDIVDIPENRQTKNIIRYAGKEATRLKKYMIDAEHILLGLLRAKRSMAVQILRNLGLDLNELREKTLDLLETSATKKEKRKKKK